MSIDVNAVAQRLHALYEGGDEKQRSTAEKWLRDFAETEETWQITQQILSTDHVPGYAHIWAANTLSNKICKPPE